jgi:hypothetical protein
MKHKLLYILLIALLNSVAQPARASFFVKRHADIPAITQVITPVADAPAVLTNATENTTDLTPPPFRSFSSRGWIGILAFLMGLAGVLFPIFAVGAVLFGFLGIGGRRYGAHAYGVYGDGTDQFLRIHNRPNRNKGLAIAGLVLGAAVIVFTIFFGFSGWGLF